MCLCECVCVCWFVCFSDCLGVGVCIFVCICVCVCVSVCECGGLYVYVKGVDFVKFVKTSPIILEEVVAII